MKSSPQKGFQLCEEDHKYLYTTSQFQASLKTEQHRQKLPNIDEHEQEEDNNYEVHEGWTDSEYENPILDNTFTLEFGDFKGPKALLVGEFCGPKALPIR